MGKKYLWELPRNKSEMTLCRPLVGKSPMKQTVFDSEGKIFNYRITNEGKVVYTYMAMSVPIKREE